MDFFIEHPVVDAVGAAVGTGAVTTVFQNCVCVKRPDGTYNWPLIRSYTKVEKLILDDPIQPASMKDDLKKVPLVVTNHTKNLMLDLASAMNRGKGAILVVCSPFGTGKTSTVTSAAVINHARMPGGRYLVVSLPTTNGKADEWLDSLTDTLGLPKGGREAADKLADALLSGSLKTKTPAWLEVVGDQQSAVDGMGNAASCPVLVLENYNPSEAMNIPIETVTEHGIKCALEKTQSFTFLDCLMNRAYGGGIVVVMTTVSKRTLQFLKNMNGNQKVFMAGCTTDMYVGNTFTIESPQPSVAQNHQGFAWTEQEEEELLTTLFAHASSQSREFADEFGKTLSNKTVGIRRKIDHLTKVAKELGVETRDGKSSGEKFDLWIRDTFMDPMRRFFCGIVDAEQAAMEVACMHAPEGYPHPPLERGNDPLLGAPPSEGSYPYAAPSEGSYEPPPHAAPSAGDIGLGKLN